MSHYNTEIGLIIEVTKSMYLRLIFVLSISFSFFTFANGEEAKSMFRACEKVDFISFKEFKKAKDNARVLNCEGKQILPEVGTIRSVLGELPKVTADQSYMTAIKKVFLKHREYLEYNISKIEDALKCYENSEQAQKEVCKKTDAHIKNLLKELWPQIRQDLSLGLPLPDGRNDIYSDLQRHPHVDIPKMKGLNREEYKLARQQFEKESEFINNECTTFIEQIQKEQSNLFKTHERLKESMELSCQKYKRNEIQNIHLLRYTEALSRAPIAMFIEKDNPSSQDIERALSNLLKNANKQLNQIEDDYERLVNEEKISRKTNERFNPDGKSLENLFAIHGIVEEVLNSNPGLCAATTALQTHIDNSKIRKKTYNYMLMAAICYSSFGIGGFVGGTLGATITTAGYLTSSMPIIIGNWLDYQNETTRAYSNYDGIQNGDVNKANEKKHEVVKSISFIPLDATLAISAVPRSRHFMEYILKR